MTIQFYVRSNYGTDYRYIVDEKLANAFFSLTGRKTILDSDIESLKVFGVEVEEVLKPKE